MARVPPITITPDPGDSTHVYGDLNYFLDSSAQYIYIAEFNVDASAALATTFGKVTTIPTVYDAGVRISIPVATAQNLFKFSTDSLDINDMSSNDMLFKVVYGSAQEHPLSINFDASSEVFDRSIVASNPVNGVTPNQNLTYDYNRYLAKELFGTATAVDLFSNESSIRNSLDASISASLNTVLRALHTNGVLTRDSTLPNPSKTILEHLLASANGRFEFLDQFTDASGSYDASGWFFMPLAVGDKLYFTVNVKCDPRQNALTNLEEVIADRKYLVEMVLRST
jgi:hypothetical protein